MEEFCDPRTTPHDLERCHDLCSTPSIPNLPPTTVAYWNDHREETAWVPSLHDGAAFHAFLSSLP